MAFWKNLGKAALKVAPIAAGFIPGVGPLASAAIGGLSAGASKKIEGGSWKDALMSGGMGAGTGYLSSKLSQGMKGKGKGIGPSKLPDEFMIPGFKPDMARQGLSTGAKIGLGALGGVAGGALLAKGLGGKKGQGEDYWGPGAQSDFGTFEQRNPNLGVALRRGQMEGRRANPGFYGVGPSYGGGRRRGRVPSYAYGMS
jgi:hypothetical protein